MKTIPEILTECEKSPDLQTLISLWNGLVKDKKKYSLNQLREVEHAIKERTLKIEGSDLERGKFYVFLCSMI